MLKIDKILIIGFGNQAKSWALNFADSGVDFSIGLRSESPSLIKAKSMGFKTIELSDELEQFSTIVLLTPDSTHGDILKVISKKIKAQTSILYAHGYSVINQKLNELYPKFYHILFAPKAIASELRFQYETGGKLGAVYSLEFLSTEIESSRKELFKLAKNLGITSGPYETSFKNETYADLFSEQTMLCAILPYVSNLLFKKLREKGIEKETAYFESWYEVKLIADTLIKIGPEKFFDLISPNALLGSYVGQKILLDEVFENKMQDLLENIYSGKFEQQAKETDLPELKKKINTFWKNQELTNVHNEMKDELFS